MDALNGSCDKRFAAEGLEQQALFRGAYCNRTAQTGDYGAAMEGV